MVGEERQGRDGMAEREGSGDRMMEGLLMVTNPRSRRQTQIRLFPVLASI